MQQINKVDKTNAMRELDVAGIVYKVHTYEYDEQHIDGISVAHTLHQDENQVFKTLITTNAKSQYFIFCIPVNSNLDLKKCAKIAKQKSLEMIPVKDINKISGYIRGGCSPVGMKKKYPTYIEETAQLFDSIFVSGGKKGCQIEINPMDLANYCQASFQQLCDD